ncbi:MAG: hypothetical protein GY898_11185, partial [Proteobacteria bacterium]|nr:hypothetical protein [Pseudomonadota bacterium]
GGGGGTGVIGGWTNGQRSNFVIFESLGYAIAGCIQARHTDNVVYIGMCSIDLTTGKATFIDVPTHFTNFPAALFEAPPFNGEQFNLGVPQFVLDDDSVPAAPKGQMFLFQSDYLGDSVPPYLDVPSHVYVKVLDWNPLGVAPAEGTPNRVHLRETLMSVIHYISFQAFGTNLNSTGAADDGGSPSARRIKPMYHQPTRTIITYNDMKWGIYDNQRGIVRHSITPELYQLEPPTAQTEVETNKTSVFKARAMGDLGEGVAGITGTWSLARRSTIDEALDTSGAPAFNVVAHPPIDPDILEVKLNGTPLVDGVDYTVVFSTGTITWIGPQSPPAASGYTASYRHSTVSAQPPHGTLLQETTETDTEGFCESRVQYPDDDELAGDRDRITVSITDD